MLRRFWASRSHRVSVLVQLHPPTEEAALAPIDLVGLAQDRSIEARERLLLGVLALCDARPPAGDLSPVLTDIFLTLARQAERDMRRILAERLADAPWAPRDLITLLARDEIEIARPVLANSPVLRDEDLLKILIEATLEHQIAIAARPRLSAVVSGAVIDRDHPAILAALAGNPTADLGEGGMRRLVERSRQLVSLRGPLARHPALTQALAAQMYHWIGAALRESICIRFKVDEADLFRAVASAADTAAATPHDATDDPQRDESDRRLVEKLVASGQLGGGYLIRAVRERRLGLFSRGLAALGGFHVSDVRRALTRPTPEALFYACAAVGIDRAVFPALLTEIRLLNGGFPGDGGERVWRKDPITPQAAGRAFKTLISAV